MTNFPPQIVEEFIGNHVAVFGTTGSGKSNTLARIAEQAADKGFRMFIIDVEGDFVTLERHRPDLFRVYGRKKSADTEGLSLRGIKKAVSRVLDDDKCAIIYLGDYKLDRSLLLERQCLELLWERANFEHMRKAVMILRDEVHEVVPQNQPADKELSYIYQTISRRGRKKGLGLAIGSQRPSDVNTKVRANCTVKFLHYVVDPRDVDAYSEMLNLGYETTTENRRHVQRVVHLLEKGECFYVPPYRGGGLKSSFQVQVLRRESNHPGSTPGLEALRG